MPSPVVYFNCLALTGLVQGKVMLNYVRNVETLDIPMYQTNFLELCVFRFDVTKHAASAFKNSLRRVENILIALVFKFFLQYPRAKGSC